MQSPSFKSSASNWYQRPFNHGLSLGDGRNKAANCPHLSFNQHRPSAAKICDKILLAGKSTRSRFMPRSLDKGEGIFLDAATSPDERKATKLLTPERCLPCICQPVKLFTECYRWVLMHVKSTNTECDLFLQRKQSTSQISWAFLNLSLNFCEPFFFLVRVDI